LLFAKRAKNIKNKPIVNQDLHQRALIGQYEIELKKLQNELQEKSRLLHSNEYVSEIEEMKSKFEKDKKEILKQLEKMSKQYMHEKEEKNKLKKILMNAQMVKNSSKIEDTPQFRVVIEEKEKLLLKELDVKFKEIEKEKQQLEEDKIEIEKYKELLLKQRDIMISLTTKINERDETITQLQDEIEKYETMNKNNKELNNIYKNSIQTLIQLCQVNSITIPECVSLLQQKENELLINDNKILNIDDQQKKINESDGNNEYLKQKGDNNNLSTSLNPHEQIKELTNIIKHQKNEIYILKLVSQKLITTSCDNDNTQIDIN
jgi:kinesin family protein 3/17